jgi:acetamidase/formamidase
MTQNVLGTSLKTCHWGYFDATLPPAMTISSGDEVVINTVSGGPSKPTGSWVPCATRIA